MPYHRFLQVSRRSLLLFSLAVVTNRDNAKCFSALCSTSISGTTLTLRSIKVPLRVAFFPSGFFHVSQLGHKTGKNLYLFIDRAFCPYKQARVLHKISALLWSRTIVVDCFRALFLSQPL